jgi:hypothetical protein
MVAMEHNNQSSRSRLGEPTGGCALLPRPSAWTSPAASNFSARFYSVRLMPQAVTPKVVDWTRLGGD